MYSDIGQKSNTMIFSDRPADVNALLAQASTVVRSLGGPAVPAATATEGASTAAASVPNSPVRVPPKADANDY